MCLLPQTIDTHGITSWMEYLVCRHISAQIGSVDCKHVVRDLALICCLSAEHGRSETNQTDLLHVPFEVWSKGLDFCLQTQIASPPS